jgi:hypothetical protein
VAASDNPGTAVSVLANGGSDVDTDALKGIAVTAVDSTHGVWQYSIDAGATWLSLAGVSESSARLLQGNDANHRIRFLPQADYSFVAYQPEQPVFLWERTQKNLSSYSGCWKNLCGEPDVFE